MHSYNKIEIHNDLLIQPYKHGIQLVNPQPRKEAARYSIANLYSSPISTYFVDAQHRCIHGKNRLNSFANLTIYSCMFFKG